MTLELKQDVTTLELGNYYIDIVKIEYFKDYYYTNIENASSIASNSFLKALDIPPKFFKENPKETQKDLLENRDTFIKEHKKYIDKVIVVAKSKVDNSVLNCSRMTLHDASLSFERLKSIDEVKNKFEHRSFIKDSYITYVVHSTEFDNKKSNKVLVVDFPLTLNKPVVIHKSEYTLPDETFATAIEHIHYFSNDSIDFEMEYRDIKEAIDTLSGYFVEAQEPREVKEILREPEVVALALGQENVIPNSYTEKVGSYIREHSLGSLDTHKLESLVLDYDETFRSYKHVTSLRGVSGYRILEVLNSPVFKEFIEEMEGTNFDTDEDI